MAGHLTTLCRIRRRSRGSHNKQIQAFSFMYRLAEADGKIAMSFHVNLGDAELLVELAGYHQRHYLSLALAERGVAVTRRLRLVF